MSMKFYVRSAEIDDRPIYITGNFTDWNPKNEKFLMKPFQDFEDVHCIEIDDSILPENIEYKFTKGGWENVEIDKYGNVTPNRKIEKKKGSSLLEASRSVGRSKLIGDSASGLDGLK